MIRAALFDLYETLITERGIERLSKARIAEALGIEVSTFEDEWQKCRIPRMTGAYGDFAETLRDICRSLGKSASEDAIQELFVRRLAAKAAAFTTIREDVLEMLQDLRTSGVRLGLISNCVADEVTAWPGCALAPAFDAVVFSHEVGSMKPEPEIYRHACKALGVLPGDAVFVGDGSSDELAGATSVGLQAYQAVWFTGAEPAAGNHFLSIRAPGDLVSILAARLRSET